MTIRTSFFVVLVLVSVLGPAAGDLRAQLQREEGAIYLQDFQKRPVRLALAKPATIFYDAALGRFLGSLRAPQQVELLAFTDTVARVKGMAGQGQVAGWIPRDALADAPAGLFDELRKTGERANLVRELIARKEVAVGMSADEVQQSLGKPARKSSRIDQNVSEEAWEYIRYQTVPQTVTQQDEYGRYYTSTIAVRVPAGQMSVILRNGVVERIERSEGVLQPEGNTLVVPPVTIQY